MIFAEGVLIGAWMIVWGTVFLFVKIATRQTWISSSLGTITPGA